MNSIRMLTALLAALAVVGCGKKYGDEIPCKVKSALGFGENIAAKYNAHLTNVHAYIDRDTGLLTITYDYDSTNRAQQISTTQYLIRLFDKNGQHLYHFITGETYSRLPVPKTYKDYVRIKDKGNVIQYQINMQNASFVKQAEFGISRLPSGSLLNDVPTAYQFHKCLFYNPA